MYEYLTAYCYACFIVLSARDQYATTLVLYVGTETGHCTHNNKNNIPSRIR